jgi:chemotaxis protein methyltransferase WspC
MVARAAERALASGGSLRILSAPCSTGEEPYSIAMTLLDAALPPGRFRIDGIDVSEALLARARAGRYGVFSFRGGDVAFRERHFRKVEGADAVWEISEPVRGAVRFVRDNLLAPARLLGEAPYDLIFCRNLLIYLTPEARRQVLDVIADRLAPEGRVVVGHAEALDALDSRFAPVGERGSFAFALRDPARAVEPPPAPVPAAPKGRSPRAAAPSAPSAPQAPPAAPARRPRPASPARAASLLELAAAHADRGELAPAAELCEERLREAADDAAAHHLLGVVRQAAGDAGAAERCFARALYCDPGRTDSMLSLALLLERRGDAAGGARLRERSARAAPRGGPA